MMQAYVAMRGNYVGRECEEDPLFEWIRQRDELAQASNPKIHHKHDVSRMLQLIDKALLSSNMGGDSPRDYVFEVYRPDFEHIKPPPDMDMSANVFTACCTDFEWNSDSDDEEANVPSGRISPCTFLEWSKGCVRWNADQNENKKDTTSHKRMRPPTPKIPLPPRQYEDRSNEYLEPQRDIYTGEELTPAYFVPTSPSIIYTPPGVDFTGFRTARFHSQYKRMAPLMERELRARIFGAVRLPPTLPDSENNCFSQSEVAAATAVVPELHNRQGPEIDATLQQQWAAVRQAEAAETALRAQAEAQQDHIRRLQLDRRHLNQFLPALQVRLEMREARARERKREAEERERNNREMMERRRARRDDAIRAYVAEHALDARGRLDTAWSRLGYARAGVADNARRIAELEGEVRLLCDRGGVRDPQHAYDVLLGVAESDSDASEAAVDGNNGAGVGAGAAGGGAGGGARGAGSGVGRGGVYVDGYGYDYGYGYGYGNYNHNNYGYGYEHGGIGIGGGIGGGVGSGGGPMGPWSNSSLARAEREYARFLADLQIGDGGVSGNRRDDNESSDSGVAGVRSQGQRFQLQPPPARGRGRRV